MFVPYQTDFQLSFCITYMWMFYVDYIDIQSKCCLFVIVHSVLWLFTIFFLQLSTLGLLICTSISENQGLEKSRSASNLRKISGLQTWIFFLQKPT
jgi:hypothetical protein